jgi:hypothetical protein
MTTLQQAAKEADAMLSDFVKDWMDSANLAHSSVDMRIEDEARDLWVVALAGNLAWAIGGFMPVTAVVKAVVMGGAILGSGTADKVANASRGKPPTPVKLIAGRIAETADALEKYLLQRRRDESWELQLSLFNLDNADEVQEATKYLWERMVFPRIKYDRRRKELLELMIKNIESQVASFKRQWQAWNSPKDRPGSKYRPYYRCMEQELQKYPHAHIGIDYKKMIERCSGGITEFQPVLFFPMQTAEKSVPDGRPISRNLRSHGSFPVPIEK